MQCDRKSERALRAEGWKMLWECVVESPKRLEKKLLKFLLPVRETKRNRLP